MELECAVQKYAWGVPGMKSSVAQLAKAASPEFEVSEEETFAELWMGTHPSGPSVIKSKERVIREGLGRQAMYVGLQNYPKHCGLYQHKLCAF